MIKKFLGRVLLLGLALLAMHLVNLELNQLIGSGALDGAFNLFNYCLIVGAGGIIVLKFVGDLVLTIVKGRC